MATAVREEAADEESGAKDGLLPEDADEEVAAADVGAVDGTDDSPIIRSSSSSMDAAVGKVSSTISISSSSSDPSCPNGLLCFSTTSSSPCWPEIDLAAPPTIPALVEVTFLDFEDEAVAAADCLDEELATIVCETMRFVDFEISRVREDRGKRPNSPM